MRRRESGGYEGKGTEERKQNGRKREGGGRKYKTAGEIE